MRFRWFWGIFFFFLLFFSSPLKAQEINKFGIHILEPADIPRAAALVNSSGGDWGWVTVVIREDDLNLQKWQDFMDQCREKHLVPLIRIATHQEGDFWTTPKPEDGEKWADFLNQLNWPVKNQYVIIFNEPNQAKEWGGKINPEEYAQVLSQFREKIKNKNENFQILNAGFDLAAPNSQTTMEVFKFWKKMTKAIPEIFNQLDGWASHSYPNHGFVGKPTASGKTSIRGYQWEIGTLKKYFGLKKDLPVFITETGWPKDNLKKSPFVDPQTAANYFQFAFENVWLKEKTLMAVTPFVLNYPQPPFAEFSWFDAQGNPFPQYEVIKNLPKQSWWPPQEEKHLFGEVIIPPFMLTESSFKGKIPLKNLGQSILGEKEKFFLPALGNSQEIFVSPAELSTPLKPNQEGFLDFQIKTTTVSGEFNIGWEKLGNYQVRVFAPSFIRKVELSFWEKILLRLRRYFQKT